VFIGEAPGAGDKIPMIMPVSVFGIILEDLSCWVVTRLVIDGI